LSGNFQIQQKELGAVGRYRIDIPNCCAEEERKNLIRSNGWSDSREDCAIQSRDQVKKNW